MSFSLNVTSPDNPTVKQICRLRDSARARREEGLFVAEGLRLCRDAAGCAEIEVSVMTDEFQRQHGDDAQVFAQKSLRTITVSGHVFKKMSDTETPQGVICVCKIPNTQHKINKSGKYVALENVADPANLGAVARTAEALGISGVLVSKNGCDRFNPKSLRASMGALLRIPVIELRDFVDDLRKLEMSLYACVIDRDAKPVNMVDFCGGAVALIGNEAKGLTPEAKAASIGVNIPMKGPTESLNAATAAAIVMWEMTR